MEAPTIRLPNVKILLCWPSRMQIYGFIENHTFLEQFDSMGYQHIFQYDRTIEWKATERSEGASKRLSKATERQKRLSEAKERQRGSLEWYVVIYLCIGN